PGSSPRSTAPPPPNAGLGPRESEPRSGPHRWLTTSIRVIERAPGVLSLNPRPAAATHNRQLFSESGNGRVHPGTASGRRDIGELKTSRTRSRLAGKRSGSSDSSRIEPLIDCCVLIATYAFTG